MEVRSGDRHINKLVNDPVFAARRLGRDLAERLEEVIEFLFEAETVDDLLEMPGLRFHSLKGDWAGHYAIRIRYRARLICSLESGRAGIILTIEAISRDHYEDL